MANILLGVTGSVAAIRTPELYAALTKRGFNVRIAATAAATYFFDPRAIDPASPARNPALVTLDADEWPGERYHRDDPVLHVELRRWADLLLIAPLDANTLAKLAYGLSDNCLTCVWRAWDYSKPIILAPAMNTLMWENPLTAHHLRLIAENFGVSNLNTTSNPAALIASINRLPTLRMIAPQSKRLACGDVGVGAMAEVEEIAAVVQSALPASGSSA